MNNLEAQSKAKQAHSKRGNRLPRRHPNRPVQRFGHDSVLAEGAVLAVGTKDAIEDAAELGIVAHREPVMHLVVLRICREWDWQVELTVQRDVVRNIHEGPRQGDTGTCGLVHADKVCHRLEASDEHGHSCNLLDRVQVSGICDSTPWYKISVVLLVAIWIQHATMRCVMEGVVQKVIQYDCQDVCHRTVHDAKLREPPIHTAGQEGIDEVMNHEVLHHVVQVQEENVDAFEHLQLLGELVSAILERPSSGEPARQTSHQDVASFLVGNVVPKAQKDVKFPVVHQTCWVEHPWH
mmetsp:Transcript_84541/g.149710  ORF Transcript_84541/g.149710 Transcript_84541/m.149710 type:complete len:294 (-) Transcript_84541:224-1105(-)